LPGEEGEAMKITAIAPWYGSKRSMAAEIIAELGPHTVFCDPFCGGMSVLMAKKPCRVEIVNDLHGDVINMALCIQDPKLGPRFYRRARRLIVADEQLLEADSAIRYDEPATMLDVDRALNFFASAWMGRNGEVGIKKSERGRKLAVRWNDNGGDPATRYSSAVSSIPAWRRRLAGVTILRRDAFEVLESIGDEDGCAIYIDPPYLHKSDQYLHDFAADDHRRLALSLARFKRARVVVSYYAHPLLAALYPGWTILDKSRTKAMGSLAMKIGDVKKVAPEVLLINGSPMAQGVLL
jgi:DNA adenine methylase